MKTSYGNTSCYLQFRSSQTPTPINLSLRVELTALWHRLTGVPNLSQHDGGRIAVSVGREGGDMPCSGIIFSPGRERVSSNNAPSSELACYAVASLIARYCSHGSTTESDGRTL